MTAVNPTIIPAMIVPMTFLFVLLIIVVSKSPKVGAWLIGGLVLVVPVLLLQVLRMSADFGVAALPSIVVPVTFLFVLLIVLTAKAPKAGAALIAVLVIIMLGVFSMFVGTHRVSQQPAIVHQSLPLAPRMPVPPVPQPVIPSPASSEPLSPIWSDGVEKEMKADVYPSKLAAVRALGSRLDRPMRELLGDVNAPPQITLFQEELDRELTLELKSAIQQVLPQATCTVEAQRKNLAPKEVGVTARLVDLDLRPAPWAPSAEITVPSGSIELRVSTATGDAALHARFVEKPWIENFATFASTRPQQAFIIARSQGTCTSESEARQQALREASRQVERIVWNSRRSERPDRYAGPVSSSELQDGGFIVDTFVQSFEGLAGKIWRQAVLLDVSSSKVARLYSLKTGEARQVRQSWARMGLSAVGVMVLIGVIYFFLNMATMGYYEWSLRIACVVLAIVGVLSILMVVK